VGKSRLIPTIFQSITWRANKLPGATDSAKVLLCAPTGKAAVFGDLKQLSPVGDRWIFVENTSNPYNILAGAKLWNNFKFFELTEANGNVTTTLLLWL